MIHKKGNSFKVRGDIVEIKLSNADEVAIVDRKDWEQELSGLTWRLMPARGTRAPQAVTNIRRRGVGYSTIPIDRMLFGGESLPPTKMVVQINGDPLDYRRANLKVMKRSEFMREAGVFDNRWDDAARERASVASGKKARAQEIRAFYGLEAKGRLPEAKEFYIARVCHWGRAFPREVT
jgi:hypothetical protein